jgi:hypothetical protein
MERIQALINQLNQQNLQGANTSQLLVTVQLLELELLKAQEKFRPAGTSKVVVTLPSNWKKGEVKESPSYALPKTPVMEEPAYAVQETSEVLVMESSREEGMENNEVAYAPSHKSFIPASEESTTFQDQEPVYRHHIPAPSFEYNTIEEAPTLVQHHSPKELNELIAERKESLNERLKQDREEVVQVLKEVPIKDLRKGIGINDRFRFLNELFRNDEPMYERSIKTINSFKVFSEAEYWINRELKYKLGWDDAKETVQLFYQLVRRRFS